MNRLLDFLKLRGFVYKPLIQVEISRQRLIENLHEFMKIAPLGNVAPVLKANAYGHGLVEIARIIESEHNKHRLNRKERIYTPKNYIPFLIVDSYYEAAKLRLARIKMPILVIGYTRPEIIAHSRLRSVSFTVTNLENLKCIRKYQSRIISGQTRRISIHIKIDTGMHRQGLLPEELEEMSHILDINSSIILTGICSHLSDADNNDPSFTESQINIWNDISLKLQSEYKTIRHVHLSNTDGHRFTSTINANVSRLGLGLYGLVDGNLFTPSLDIKPVLSVQTIITGIKNLKRDETVSYSNTFKAEKDMRIATIPIGYYEGLDRRLSNQGYVTMRNDIAPCKIIGRVCMNITIIDITDILNAEINMPITVISNETDHENSIINIAKTCGTIPYEIAVHIHGDLRRTIVD